VYSVFLQFSKLLLFRKKKQIDQTNLFYFTFVFLTKKLFAFKKANNFFISTPIIKYAMTRLLLKKKLRSVNVNFENDETTENNSFYLENKMYAEFSQRFSETKISYLPLLCKGLLRVKRKMPFKSELFFTDKQSEGFALYQAIKAKKRLKHRKQR
jgi:hypothetical protein